MIFNTLLVRREGAVLFVDIAAPPVNLLGPDLVSLISKRRPPTTTMGPEAKTSV